MARTKREVILLQHKVAEIVAKHPDIRREDIAAMVGMDPLKLCAYVFHLKRLGVVTSRYLGHYRIGDTSKLRPIPEPKPPAADKAQQRERKKREQETIKKQILDALDHHGAMATKDLAAFLQTMPTNTVLQYLEDLHKEGLVQRYGRLHLLAGEKLPPQPRPARVVDPITIPLKRLMAGR